MGRIRFVACRLQRVALAVVVRGGRILVARRRAAVHLGSAWEFPGGKVRVGEEPAGAALRELAEETGLVGDSAQELTEVVYDYPDRTLELKAFLIGGTCGEARPLASQEIAWVGLDELEPSCMPPANAEILARLGEHLRQAAAGTTAGGESEGPAIRTNSRRAP